MRVFSDKKDAVVTVKFVSTITLSKHTINNNYNSRNNYEEVVIHKSNRYKKIKNLSVSNYYFDGS